MGRAYTAKCKKCDEEFECNEGGSFRARLFKCDTCGKDCWCLRSLEGELIPEEYDDPPKKPPEQCECGGQFKIGAPPRCPKCRSTEIEMAPESDLTMYD